MHKLSPMNSNMEEKNEHEEKLIAQSLLDAGIGDLSADIFKEEFCRYNHDPLNDFEDFRELVSATQGHWSFTSERMEGIALKAIECFVKLKSNKSKDTILLDPQEIKLTKHCKQILEILKKRDRKRKKEFRIPFRLNRMFLEEKMVEVCNTLYDDEEMIKKSLRYEKEIIKTAEDWIENIKAIHYDMNKRNEDFYKEKLFWCEFEHKLRELADFSQSEEYKFMLKLIERVGRRSIVMSLELLLKNSNVQSLADSFNSFFNEFEFTFIYENKQSLHHMYLQRCNAKENPAREGCYSVYADSECSEIFGFLKNALNVIVKMNRIPSTIQRYLFRQAINLRNQVLLNCIYVLNFGKFCESADFLLEFFQKLDIFLSKFQLYDCKTGLGYYIEILGQIHRCSILFYFINKINRDFYPKKSVLKRIKEIEFDFISYAIEEDSCFFTCLNEKMIDFIKTETGISNKNTHEISASDRKTRSDRFVTDHFKNDKHSNNTIESREFNDLITKLSDLFQEKTLNDLNEVFLHYGEFKKLFDLDFFVPLVENYNLEISKKICIYCGCFESIETSNECTTALSNDKSITNNYMIYDFSKVLQFVEWYRGIKEILTCFSGTGRRSIEKVLINLKCKIHTFFNALPKNLSNEVVIENDCRSDDVQSEINQDSFFTNFDQLAEIKIKHSAIFEMQDILSQINGKIYAEEKIEELVNSNFTNIMREIHAICKHYCDIKYFLKKHSEIPREFFCRKNYDSKTKSPPENERSSFSENDILEFFSSLVNLKWKYFNESKFEKIRIKYLAAENEYKSFKNTVDDLFSAQGKLKEVAEKLIKKSRKFDFDSIIKFFEIDFSTSSDELLQFIKDYVLKGYLVWLFNHTDTDIFNFKIPIQIDMSKNLKISDIVDLQKMEHFLFEISMIGNGFNIKSFETPEIIWQHLKKSLGLLDQALVSASSSVYDVKIDNSNYPRTIFSGLSRLLENSKICEIFNIIAEDALDERTLEIMDVIQIYKNAAKKEAACVLLFANKVPCFDISVLNCSKMNFSSFKGKIEKGLLNFKREISCPRDFIHEDVLRLMARIVMNSFEENKDIIESDTQIVKLIDELKHFINCKNLVADIDDRDLILSSENLPKSNLGRTFSTKEYEIIESRRKHLISEIDRIQKLFNSFVSDDFNFVPLLIDVCLDNFALCKELDRFNVFLRYYKFKEINADANLGRIAQVIREYNLYSSKKGYLDGFLDQQLSRCFVSQNDSDNKCDIQSASTEVQHNIEEQYFCYEFLLEGIEYPIKTSILKNLVDFLGRMKVPLAYLKTDWNAFFAKSNNRNSIAINFKDQVDVNASFEAKKAYYTSLTLREFINTFNEPAIEVYIQQFKSDCQVCEYLENFSLKITENLKFKYVKGFNFICNLKEMDELLTQKKEDFDLIVKFNKFRFYAPELGEIEASILENIKLITMFQEVQEQLYVVGGVFNADPGMLNEDADGKNENKNLTSSKSVGKSIYEKDSILSEEDKGMAAGHNECLEKKNTIDSSKAGNSFLSYEKGRYEEIRSLFNGLFSKNKNISQLELNLTNILSKTNMLVNSMKCIFDEYRKQCSRLYFISNEDLIKIIQNKAYIVEIVKVIFNVEEMEIKDNKITRIFSKNNDENLILLDRVDLDCSVPDIINSLELSLRNTIKDYFFNLANCNTSNKIDQKSTCSLMEELFAEFRHFNPSNNRFVNGKNNEAADYKMKNIDEFTKKHPEFLEIYLKPKMVDNSLFLANNAKTISLAYRFEYYPPSSFIFTSLTAKIFSSILLSYHMSGAILYGPSGTGKTETIKYFCRSIGVPLYVFCCNENNEAISLVNIIVGCAKVHSFVCFDEFNRLRKEVMSAVTECIHDHKDKIKVFLTMNLGYKGRFDLPKSLKSIFGEIRVSEPDVKDIVFYYTKSYQVYNIIKRLESQILSGKNNHDFGLRAVKYILSDISICNDEGKSSNEILKLAYFYLASFAENERNILFKVLEEFDISLSLDFSCENLLNVATTTRNGIIVSGGLGKTSLLNSVAQSRECCVFRYNPSNILLTNTNIFGSVEDVTNEWKDSIFLSNLRGCLRQESDKNTEFWFIFDGPIKSEWVEDFNSVLDDNRIICLSTGERIYVPFNYKFIFETDGIEDVTPATLTRVFHITLSSIVVNEKTTDEIESSFLASEKKLYETDEGLDVNQYKAITNIKAALLSERVLFFKGPRGIGKKHILKKLYGERLSVFYHDQIIKNEPETLKNRVIYIEEFDKAIEALEEQVREYGEFGKIGEYLLDNVKIICGIDCNFGISIKKNENVSLGDSLNKKFNNGRVYGKFKVLEIRNIENPESIFRALLSADNKIIPNASENFQFEDTLKFCLFIYDTFSYTIRQMALFISLIESFSSFDQLYFLYTILFPKSEVVKSFIESLANIEVQEMFFNPKTLQVEVKSDNVNFKENKICFLLNKRVNIIISGKRLSGKRTLAVKCLSLLKNRPDTKTFHWSEKVKKEMLSKEHFILILKDEALNLGTGPDKTIEDDVVEVNSKFLEENSVKVKMDKASLVLNTEQLTKDVDFDKCVHYGNIENDCIVFENFYKMINFYRIFTIVRDKFSKKFVERKNFLEMGLKQIENFNAKAVNMRSEIQNESEILKNENIKLEENVRTLESKERVANKEEEDIRKSREHLGMEAKVMEAKKELADRSLSEAYTILKEAKDNISLISKSHLSEIKAMNNPPEYVRRTIEYIYYIMMSNLQGDGDVRNTNQETKMPLRRIEWSVLQSFLKKDDFLKDLVNASANNAIKIPNHVVEAFSGRKQGADEFTFERVSKASKTCGYFFNWIYALIKYKHVECEIEPLKEEFQSIVESLENQNLIIKEKENELKQLKDVINKVKSSIEKNKQEIARKKDKLDELVASLGLLETVIERFKFETVAWQHAEKKCPLAYMLEEKFILEYCKNVYVLDDSKDYKDSQSREAYKCLKPKDSNLGSEVKMTCNEDFDDFKKDCIRVSLFARNFEKTASNSRFYKTGILIEDADIFNPTVYSLLKNSLRKNDFKVVLFGSSYKIYSNECYQYLDTEKYKISRISKLNEYENRLLEYLIAPKETDLHKHLENIYKTQMLLEEERNHLEAEKDLSKKYKFLNEKYKKISNLFLKAYKHPLSFHVFNEFINSTNFINPADGKSFENDIIDLFFSFSFASFPAKTPFPTYDIRELLNYSFDYTFITSFNDVLFKLRNLVEFDVEISAGSPKNNLEIINLLQENSKKIILVKNTEFMPKFAKKTGTNRFIFTIGKNEHHFLMKETRIVYFDRDIDLDSIYKGLLSAFHCPINEKIEELIRFHSHLVKLEMDFSQKDLKICVENSAFSTEFLQEIVYYSRMEPDQKDRLKNL